jgi:hypothetical protein
MDSLELLQGEEFFDSIVLANPKDSTFGIMHSLDMLYKEGPNLVLNP